MRSAIRHPARKFENKQRVQFAHEFRVARAFALRDGEAFEEQLLVMERLGTYLSNCHGGLKEFEELLEGLARESVLSFDAARKFPQLHSNFASLYDQARIGRNDAMHQGAVARHLARHAQELALIMEDALMNTATTAKDFMIRDPTCAELWEPLSAIRRVMLLNAFSYLPFQCGNEWRFLSDTGLVSFLRSGGDRKKKMLMTLEDALADKLPWTKARLCGIDESIEKLAKTMRTEPCLVVADKRLVGLITAFDLL